MAARNFADKTIWTGDNLDILRGMNSESVDLIYLDPPFNSNQDYAAPVGSKAAGAAFKDTWTLSDLDVAWMGLIADEHPSIAYLLDTAGRTHGKGMQSYLTMMAVRLLEIRRVLKSTGSIYLHCDPTASHYLKLLMDAVFGRGNFRNEIVWCYFGPSNVHKNFPRKHDTLLFYSKTASYTFNREAVRIPYKILVGTPGGIIGDQHSQKRVNELREKGKIVEDYWTDIFPVVNQKEKTGYPTQKPLALLERIIKASSNEGDVVLDPFCGCATACVAADKLDRQWVGIDISPKAADLVHERLRDLYDRPLIPYEISRRTDIPQRTDIDAPIPYRQNKHVLFGQQEGLCNGCGVMFPFRNFTVDHMVPQVRGGTDHLDNLQLLCGACNSLKGDRTQEYLVARLKEMSI